MNPISNVISDKADELFDNKESDTEDEILDLEAEVDERSPAALSRLCVGEMLVENEENPSATSASSAQADAQDKEKDNNEPNKRSNERPQVSSLNEEKYKKTESTSQLKSMIHSMKDQLDSMLRLLNGEDPRKILINQDHATSILHTEQKDVMLETGERIVEGVFNGEKMIGPDGKEYAVPPNYASKSKLVEGDIMKLTITNNGRFIYKQISPIEKKRLVGELVSNGEQWSVLADGKTYKILTASVTFYKGKPGDEVIFFVAKDGGCSWGAVENIVTRNT